MTGLFFGALGFGNLSDSIGRKQTMLISVTSAMILNSILYFVNHPTGTVLAFWKPFLWNVSFYKTGQKCILFYVFLLGPLLMVVWL